MADWNKNIAKSPIPRTGTYLKYGFVIMEHEYQMCPRCYNILNAGPNYQPEYCGQCGQKGTFSQIEWTEDKKLGYAEREEDYEQVKNRVV